MARSANNVDVYLEIGQNRTFAGVIDWPGWCRGGRSEETALRALLEYGPRYARVVRPAGLEFRAPADESTFTVVERLKGNATTDFGAPAMAPSRDADRLEPNEISLFEKILKACWQTLDVNIKAAGGKMLRAGPRGGGRQLESIMEHLLGSDAGYLSSVGWKLQKDDTGDLDQQLEQTRQAILSALAASARGEIPARGPRGGTRWTPRYFVRRVAWHTLDHAWEIEDRLASG